MIYLFHFPGILTFIDRRQKINFMCFEYGVKIIKNPVLLGCIANKCHKKSLSQFATGST
jgi:hypothetical protein